MKKIFLSVFALFVAIMVTAQVPPAFNYQAVARNNAGAALVNQTMQVRLSIKQGSTALYSETRTVTTNLLGLFNVQIGSVGATSTTGSISAIDWYNSAAGWLSLKVELDLANNNIFTDMGTQALASVPFALATEKANKANELYKFPVDTLVVPAAGNRLMFDGSKWTPVKKDSTYMIAGSIANIPVTAGNPWVFAGPTSIVTVTGNETVAATFTGVFGHSGASGVLLSSAICYSDLSATNLTSFNPNIFSESTVLASPNKTLLTATGAIKLPAGTYRIGLGVKNKSISTVLNANDNISGTIEIKY